jgi:hypothetical protein
VSVNEEWIFHFWSGVVDCSTASRKERKNNPWSLAPGHVSAVLGPAVQCSGASSSESGAATAAANVKGPASSFILLLPLPTYLPSHQSAILSFSISTEALACKCWRYTYTAKYQAVRPVHHTTVRQQYACLFWYQHHQHQRNAK